MTAKRMYDEQKRKQAEYEKDVMKSRGYSTRDEYLAWESDQKSGLDASRTRSTIR
jgi:hypothetical protein